MLNKHTKISSKKPTLDKMIPTAGMAFSDPARLSNKNNIVRKSNATEKITDFSATHYPPQGGSRDTRNILIKATNNYDPTKGNTTKVTPHTSSAAIIQASGNMNNLAMLR